jgi:hypothetical protein
MLHVFYFCYFTITMSQLTNITIFYHVFTDKHYRFSEQSQHSEGYDVVAKSCMGYAVLRYSKFKFIVDSLFCVLGRATILYSLL